MKDAKPTFYDNLMETDTSIGMGSAIRFKRILNTETNNLKSNEPIDLVIVMETGGGEIGAIKMICDAIGTFKNEYNGNIFTVVRSHAFSGGSIIALSSDYIMLDKYSVLSKIDPQMSGIPIKYFKKEDDDKNNGLIDKIADGLATDGYGTLEDILSKHVKPKYDDDTYSDIIENFVLSDRIHGHSFTKQDCIQMGLKIDDIPDNL